MQDAGHGGALIDGHFSIFSQIRCCKQCLAKEIQCLNAASIVYITDCEEGNKKAIEQVLSSKQEKTIVPAYALVHALPDAVHVSKSVMASFANWFILTNQCRCSLAILMTLREASDEIT